MAADEFAAHGEQVGQIRVAIDARYIRIHFAYSCSNEMLMNGFVNQALIAVRPGSSREPVAQHPGQDEDRRRGCGDCEWFQHGNRAWRSAKQNDQGEGKRDERGVLGRVGAAARMPSSNRASIRWVIALRLGA